MNEEEAINLGILKVKKTVEPVYGEPVECIICGNIQNEQSYDDWKCNKCGQKYVYDEDQTIKLTEKQLLTLRGLRNNPVLEKFFNSLEE